MRSIKKRALALFLAMTMVLGSTQTAFAGQTEAPKKKASKAVEYEYEVLPQGPMASSARASSYETDNSYNDGPASWAFNGSTADAWHTKYEGATRPHYIAWELGGEYQIGRIKYQSRDGAVNGVWKSVAIKANIGGGTWKQVYVGPVTNGGYIDFEPVTASGLHITIEDANAIDKGWVSAGEINVYKATEKVANVTVTVNVDGTETIVEVPAGTALGDKMPADPTKEGYAFKGWNTKADGTGEAVTKDTVVNAALTMYAIFEEEEPETGVCFDVSVVFDDANNKDGDRPESMEVGIKNGTKVIPGTTIVLSEANNWTGRFKNLPETDDAGKTINYLPYIVSPDAITKDDKEGYEFKRTGKVADGFTFTAIKSVNLKVQVNWDDEQNVAGVRGSGFSIVVREDGKSIANINIGGSRQYPNEVQYNYTTFKPKYDVDGSLCNYTVAGPRMASVKYEEPGQVTANEDGVYVLDYKLALDKKETVVKVVWDDGNNADGIRPSTEIVLPVQQCTSLAKAWRKGADRDAMPVTKMDEKITLNVANNYEQTVTIPYYDAYYDSTWKQNYYGIKEADLNKITVPAGYTVSYSSEKNAKNVYPFTVDGDKASFTITFKHEVPKPTVTFMDEGTEVGKIEVEPGYALKASDIPAVTDGSTYRKGWVGPNNATKPQVGEELAKLYGNITESITLETTHVSNNDLWKIRYITDSNGYASADELQKGYKYYFENETAVLADVLPQRGEDNKAPGAYFVKWEDTNSGLTLPNPGETFKVKGAKLTQISPRFGYYLRYIDGEETVLEKLLPVGSLYSNLDSCIPEDLTKEGYEFLGWKYKDNEPLKKADIKGSGANINTTDRDVTYTAVWKEEATTVTFMDEGTEVGKIEVEPGYALKASDIPAVTDGSTYRKGWVGPNNATKPQVGEELAKLYGNITESITLETTHVSNNDLWKIRYITDSNGYASADELQKGYKYYFEGETAVLADALPQRAEDNKAPGAYFIKWETNNSGVKLPNPGESFVVKGAKLTQISPRFGYYLRYIDGEETVLEKLLPVGSLYSNLDSCIPEDLTKERYEFLGWKYKDNEPLKKADIKGSGANINTTDRDVTYTAVWKQTEATVTFKTAGNGCLIDEAGNECWVSKPIEYKDVKVGETVKVPGTKGSKGTQYYEFAYWKNSKGEKVELGETLEVTGDETYTAYFELGTYTVTFRVETPQYGYLAENGVKVDEITATVKGKKYVNIPKGSNVVPNPNCEFVTWKDGEGKEISYTRFQPDKDETYTAVFAPKSYLYFYYKVVDENGEILKNGTTGSDIGGYIKVFRDKPYKVVSSSVLKYLDEIGYELDPAEQSEYEFLYTDLDTYTLNGKKVTPTPNSKENYISFTASKKVRTVTFKTAINGSLVDENGNTKASIEYKDAAFGSEVKVPGTKGKQYYEFAYWKNSAGEKVELGDTVEVTANETYTAYFTLGEYNVTFRVSDPKYGKLMDKGTAVDEFTVKVKGKQNATLPTKDVVPTTNCEFVEWQDEEGNTVRGKTVTPDRDRVYTAVVAPCHKLSIKYKVVDSETGEVLTYESKPGKFAEISGSWDVNLNVPQDMISDKTLGKIDSIGYELNPAEQADYEFLYTGLNTYTLNGKPIELPDLTKDYVVFTATKKVHSIEISGDENVNVDPIGKVDVIDGDDLTINFEPKDGYSIDKIIVDGEEITGEDLANLDGKYTFEDVDGSHDISFVTVKDPVLTWYFQKDNGEFELVNSVSYKAGTYVLRSEEELQEMLGSYIDGLEFDGWYYLDGDKLGEKIVGEIEFENEAEYIVVSHYVTKATPGNPDDGKDDTDNSDKDNSDKNNDGKLDTDKGAADQSGVKTGDTTNAGMFVVTMLFAAAAILVIFDRKRKQYHA